MNVISSPRRSSAVRHRSKSMLGCNRALLCGSACHRFERSTPQVCHQERATSVDPHIDRQHTKDSLDEASLSAKCSQTCEEARVSVTDEHSRRPCRPPFSSSEGPHPLVGVIDPTCVQSAPGRGHATRSGVDSSGRSTGCHPATTLRVCNPTLSGKCGRQESNKTSFTCDSR